MIQKSVHDIVDFIYAKGDIEPAFVSKNKMQEGTKVHVQVASTYPDATKEYFVKVEQDVLGYEVKLQGRIDLLEIENDMYHVIEVKSTAVLADDKEEMNPNHFAQAKFYGYMLYHTMDLSKEKSIQVSVMYVNKYSYAKQFFTKTYNFFELEAFFKQTMEDYLAFCDLIDAFKEQKINSINELRFPYPKFRSGQGLLMKHVYENVVDNTNLFVNAPTGIGKSLGTIYPSLKALNDGKNQIFYLTAKSVVKDVARNAVQILRDNGGLSCKSLSITAKEKICINDVFKCNPKDCPFAKNFYGKLKEAITDIYEQEDDFYSDTIMKYAEKHEVCPFEYQLSLSLFSDIVICDYNYVFDIRVYLRRFFDVESPDITLLIDEAHNMYDRVTSMFTTDLCIGFLEEIIHLTKDDKVLKSCYALVSKLDQYYQNLVRNQITHKRYDDLDQSIINEIMVLLGRLETYFEKLRDEGMEVEETLLLLYFDLLNFSKIAEYFSDDFMIWCEIVKEDIKYQITCLNPRELIKMRTNQVKSTIFFSATLHPIDYFIYLLGGDQNSNRLLIHSPFEKENLELIINNQISTKYKDREHTKYQIAEQIVKLIKRKGKYLIYFPSYHYLEIVYNLVEDQIDSDVILLKQERYMSEWDRTRFIDTFDLSTQNVAGFAVLGGAFSEGIDLQGERLNGVAVIGVGLPTFDDFRKELRAYFDQEGQNGYRFAFTYPGFNKVLQAVGRVIRGEEDLGVALLIDERYLSYEYVNLFPRHWSHYKKINL